jgi:hypothetical protein
MSAYVVGRNHIRYLVEAAQHIAIRDHSPNFSWYHNRERQELTSENASEVAQMLWNENIASVQYRYPDDTDETMPGPMGETFVYYHQTCPEQGRRMAGPYFKHNFNVAQILMSTDCYEYQSCEHPGWESSEAYSFIQALRRRTWPHMPGYRDATWGGEHYLILTTG